MMTLRKIFRTQPCSLSNKILGSQFSSQKNMNSYSLDLMNQERASGAGNKTSSLSFYNFSDTLEVVHILDKGEDYSISKTDVPTNMSENPTISNFFKDKKMPLGRWCNKLSSEKCDQERKADLANHDNNLCPQERFDPQYLSSKGEYDSSSDDDWLASYYLKKDDT